MSSRFLPDSSIEIIRERDDLGRVKHVLLDFDGTVSLLREGWQGVMIPLIAEMLGDTPRGRDEEGLEELARGYIAESTGRQTIYQMIWLADEVAARGGTRREAEDYKAEYLRRLHERIRDRLAALESGSASPADYLVPGALELLDMLRERGCRLYVASGTDEPDVRREAELLGVAELFEGRIWGAQADYRSFSKKMIIERLIAENELAGPELLTIGDGYVEIEEGARAGGLTVGAATDEAEKSGNPDTWKRERLIAAGADLIVPDFCQARELVEYLWNCR